MGEFVKTNFVSCYEQVGQFHVSTAISIQHANMRERLGKAGGNVVTYFCTSEKQVLLYLVGPVSADEFMKGAQFAKMLNQKLQGLDKTQQVQKIREAHQQAVPSELMSAFDRWRENLEEFDRRPVLHRLNATVQFVAQVQKELRTAMPKPPRQATKFQLEQFAAFYRRAAEVERSEPHLFLAAISPVAIQEVQAPIFERLAGQKFVERTPRNQDLLETVQANIKAARPTVLVVTDHHYASPSEAHKIPKHRDLEARDDFSIVPLTKLELVRLMDDTDQEPVESVDGLETRYVVLDVTGQRISTIGQSNSGTFRAIDQNRTLSVTQRGGGGLLLLEALKLAQKSD